MASWRTKASALWQVAVVGGGAGGVEMALAMNEMLQGQWRSGELPSACKPQVTCAQPC